MEDAAIYFEKATTLAMAFLEEKEVVYKVGLQTVLTKLKVSLRELASFSLCQPGREVKRYSKKLVLNHYVRPIQKLVKEFGDTHAPAGYLLQCIGLPTEFPQGMRNQLLAKRGDVELAMIRLGEEALVELLRCIEPFVQHKRSTQWVEERLHTWATLWIEAGQQRLLDDRMAYFRMIVYWMGERAQRTHFIYVGATHVTSRPFCAVRVGRVFNLQAVLSWNRMHWLTPMESNDVMAKCGGSCCRHLLLPVDLPQGVQPEPLDRPWVYPVVPLVDHRDLDNLKMAWSSNTVVGQWHDAAFGHAPFYLQQAVGWSKAPAGGIRNTLGEDRMMFVIDQSGTPYIEMGGIKSHNRLLPFEKLIWRHEFGHYIDYFMNCFNNLPFSFKDSGLKRALLKDGYALAMRVGLVGVKSRRLERIIKTNRLFNRWMRQLVLISSREREAWFSEAFGLFGVTFKQVELALRSSCCYRGFDQEQPRLVLLLTALYQRDPVLLGEQVMEWQIEAHQQLGMALILGDYFGAMTNAMVGCGHTATYYQADPIRRAAEAFANGVALLGDSNPFWSRLLHIMTPRFTARMIEILKDHRHFRRSECLTVPIQ